jgi:hypothetical protein
MCVFDCHISHVTYGSHAILHCQLFSWEHISRAYSSLATPTTQVIVCTIICQWSAHLSENARLHTHACTHKRTHARTHTRTRVLTHTHTLTHPHTHTHTHSHTPTHTHTHTYTRVIILSQRLGKPHPWHQIMILVWNVNFSRSSYEIQYKIAKQTG